MAAHRPFRFGIQVSNAASRDTWSAVARKAEDLGFSTFFMPDHFGDQLAPVPALMAAADATTELRATLDDTNGRVEALAAGGADDVAGAREAVLGLLGAFARHRQLGADLVYEAYETDIGGG